MPNLPGLRSWMRGDAAMPTPPRRTGRSTNAAPMPTIHKPFLLKLLLALILFSGSLVGAHTLQYKRIPEGLKRQADRAAESRKTDTAIRYLRQYLEFQPDDIDALVELAELQKMRNPSQRGRSELLFLYDKILRLDPDRESIRREALEQAIDLGRNPDAITHAEILLKDHGNEAELWRHLGLRHTRMNKLADARRAYETSIARAPEEMIGYPALAEVLWKNGHDPVAAPRSPRPHGRGTPSGADGLLLPGLF